jgi:hypothetical protein
MCLFALALPALAGAQTVTDQRVWLGFVAQGRARTASRWRWSVDTQLRTREGVSEVDLIVVRPYVGRDLTSRSSVWGGYVHSATFLDGGGFQHENRIFQQFSWVARPASATVTLRTRVEQRFIEGNSGMLLRLREQIRVTRAIGDSKFTVVAWDEIGVHTNSTSRTARGFDQNRFFAGLAHPLSASTRLEAGYLNQYQRTRAGNRNNHVLYAGVTLAR